MKKLLKLHRGQRIPAPATSSFLSAPFVLVGLGNPGPAYAGTRHNVGFDFLDRLTEHLGISWKSPWFRPLFLATSPHLVCAKPQTFMNRSGSVLPYIRRRFSVEQDRICVIVDNMDLPPGEVRMKRRGGTSGHNGLKSVSEVLGSDDYPRVYIGIGRPAPGGDTVDHVLGRFPGDERLRVDAAMDRIVPVIGAAGSGVESSLERLISAVNDRRRPPDGEAER